MKRLAMLFLAGMVVLLSGCATTVRSDVTTFHQWPADLPNRNYVFEAPPPADDTLEWRQYQNIVKAELSRLGMTEVGADQNPALAVNFRFMTTVIPVRVIQVAYPHYFTSMRLGYFHPRRRGYWGGWYSPYWYDPFWYGMPHYEETVENNYQREVQVAIRSRSDNKRLFDVTVRNVSREMSTPQIMPALIGSAFHEFPGPSGVSRVIEVKVQPKQ